MRAEKSKAAVPAWNAGGDRKTQERARALKAAFPHTIPVLTGYAFLGIAYGILMNSKGYGAGWAVLTSLVAFAGSAQYVAVTLLTSTFRPLYTLLLTLVINARHLFYGISMLEKYRDTGRLKPYLIFGLSDETFSIVCSVEPPEDVNYNWFVFFITLLDHSYWICGTALGGLLGYLISFSTQGLDFVLTALFVVILLEQWKNRDSRGPAVIGITCSVICLAVFGQGSFIIPAMIAILAVLALFQKKLAKEEES